MKLISKKYVEYEGNVYDIKVSTLDHSYSINNIVVHNSSGGSLVAYLTGITQIDPLEFDLLFERFLNFGRMGKWEERPLYEVELENGDTVKLAEGSLVRIKRNDKETIVFVHDLLETDEIIKY